MRGQDNVFYLTNNIDKKKAAAGAIFLDSRCEPGFSGFNSIIYGHNMKSGAMFHDLIKFEAEDFWNANKSGWLFLPNTTYQLSYFACMIVEDADPYVYGYLNAPRGDRGKFFDYIRRNALRYRDPGLEAGDSVLTLSTCSSEYAGARLVLIASMREA